MLLNSHHATCSTSDKWQPSALGAQGEVCDERGSHAPSLCPESLSPHPITLLQSSSRSSHYGAWSRSGAWGSRRSSWNSLARGHSLKHKPPSAEHESLLSGETHRAAEGELDGTGRVFHHRRTLSLDNKGSCDLLELASVPSGHRVTHRLGAPPGASEHQDCNGKMPSIVKEIFPKMNNHKERGEDDEEIDYVSTWWGSLGLHHSALGSPKSILKFQSSRPCVGKLAKVL